MTFDLDRCTGCSACISACYVENNIPLVGEAETRNVRQMAWLRIDRWVGDGEPDLKGGRIMVAPSREKLGDTDIRNSPMFCQHCGSAPCEPVCPVIATYHNEEGLYAAKAEAEYWKMKSLGGGASASDTNEEGAQISDSADYSVVSRMAAYEKEISKLKSELREASGRAELALNTAADVPTISASIGISAIPVQEARSVDQDNQPSTLTALQQKRQDKRHVKELEEEDEARRQEFERIADKYLSDDDEGEGDDATSQLSLENESQDGILPSESNLSGVDDAATTASVESFLRRQSHMDAHLLELTTSIAAKEDLM